MRSIRGCVLSFFILASGFGNQSVFALVPLHSFSPSHWGEQEISLANPTTHGEFKPRLFGSLAQTSLQMGTHRVRWLAMAHEKGATHLWGDPVLFWPSDVSLQEIDQILRRFINENRGVFKITDRDLQMDTKRVLFSGPYRYITYQRTLRGFPVEGAFVSFRFKDRKLIQITNHSFGEISSVEAPVLSPQEALETVYYDSQFVEGRDRIISRVLPYLQPFYLPNGKIDYRFVYNINIQKDFPKGLWEYSISARDGEIVRLLNNFHTLGQVGGELFRRTPADGIDLFSFADLKVAGEGDLRPVFTDREGLFDLPSSYAKAFLSGVRANVLPHGGSNPSVQGGSESLLYFSAQNHLSENMAYYHVTEINRFVSQFIGGEFLRQPVQVNTRVKHPLVKECNAWFDPRENSLNFLEPSHTCEGSARISDIIYHEWGHFLDNALGGIYDAAFSEAIGDILSLLMTGDPELAPGFVREESGGIRSLRVVKVYPTNRARDPHTEGLIVGGAWYETFVNFTQHYGIDEGREKFANVFLKHLVSTESYLDSYMGALVVDDDDGNLNNCTPHMCFLNSSFARRGLTSADPRCTGQENPLPVCADSTVLQN